MITEGPEDLIDAAISQDCWSDDICTANYSVYSEICAFPSLYWVTSPTDISLNAPVGRILLMEEGLLLTPDFQLCSAQRLWTGPEHYCAVSAGHNDTTHWIDMSASGISDSLQAAPHLRRDRYWRRVQLAGGENFKVLIGNTNYDLAVSYTSGTSSTETESFGRSVTATAGADFGALSTSVA